MLTFICTLDVKLSTGKLCGITIVRQKEPDSDYWIFKVRALAGDLLRSGEAVDPVALSTIEKLVSVAVGQNAHWIGFPEKAEHGWEIWRFSGDPDELAVPVPSEAFMNEACPDRLSYPND